MAVAEEAFTCYVELSAFTAVFLAATNFRRNESLAGRLVASSFAGYMTSEAVEAETLRRRMLNLLVGGSVVAYCAFICCIT